jgi:PadR family transcriptional regulator, regulatory protein PadR
MEPPVSAKAALLQALIRGEGYGLDLIKRVNDLSSGGVKLHQGNVYPALRDLEEDGIVKSWRADPTPERGGRPRRYYKLTAAGQKAALQQSRAVAGLFGLGFGRGFGFQGDR